MGAATASAGANLAKAREARRAGVRHSVELATPEEVAQMPLGLSLADVQRITGYNLRHLQKMATEGRLPARKFGRNWVVSKPALLNMLGLD